MFKATIQKMLASATTKKGGRGLLNLPCCSLIVTVPFVTLKDLIQTFRHRFKTDTKKMALNINHLSTMTVN